MSLLTPSEFVRFQSFLASIDHGEDSVIAPEWSLYSPTHSQQQLQGNETLAKATKDLISLEPAPASHDSLAPWQHSPTVSNSPHFTPHQTRHQSFSQQSPPTLHPPQHHDRRYSDYEYRYTHQPQRPPPELFPFLKPTQPPDYHSYLAPHAQRHNTSDLIGRPLPLLDTSAQHQQQLLHPGSRHSGGAGHTPPSSATSASPPPSNSSRPSPPIASSSSKRNLDGAPSTSVQPPKRSRGSISGQKPALLSPSQKKANHIQSEQKRRANIRRGYDALCEAVPELREAIREEEAAMAADGAQGKSRPKRNKTGKGKGDDGAVDKSDGRAGPRSENVVLSKTIDYIHDLLAERENLVSRLTRARTILPPDHPALVPTQEPLWEREWTGGTGRTEAVDDDDEGEEDDHS